LAVGAVVVDRNGRVLLIRRGRAPAAGAWTLPGGRIETGESPAAAVVREVREETGLRARVVSDLGPVTVSADGILYLIHEHLLVCMADDVLCAGDDAAEARWASPSEVLELGVRGDARAVAERGVAEARALGYVIETEGHLTPGTTSSN
jgi:ADP-ribose pyrophosphatase YjhB (NUDIX family)